MFELSSSLSRESDGIVILSEARVARVAKDLLSGSEGSAFCYKQVLRACGAQDDMLAAFALQ